ncbi:hypothetical protein Tco_0290860 [Tanacetum coccineum]
MALRPQAEEQGELTVKEKAKLFQQLLEKRRKHFATKRAKEKRNKPPTKAQQRSIITELVERTEVMEENDDQEIVELQRPVEIVSDEEEVAIDVIPLATKPPSIVGWKIIKEGKISNFQIIRANGTKHGSTRLEEGYERVLWGDLKTMFEPNVEDMGRIVGIKRLLDYLEVTAIKVRVTAVKHNLVLFSNLSEKYAK